MAVPSTVPSPCIRNCCLDERDVCMGCGRSLDEIRAWGEAADAERYAVLERAAVRRAEREARRQAWQRGGNAP
jgi:predicted Fe-S protein YdhL (DUF1289 family)